MGRESGDQHPFDDDVRVAFHEDTVDPGAGVAFIGVADEVARAGGGVAQEVPLAACREATSGPSAEAAIEHLFDDRLGVHLKRLAEAFVTVVRDVVVDILRVDAAAVFHHAADLALHEWMVSEQRDFRAGEPFDHAERELGHINAFGDDLLKEGIDAIGGDVRVEDGARAGGGADGDCRLHPAETPGADDPDLGIEVVGADGGAHGSDRRFRAAGDR